MQLASASSRADAVDSSAEGLGLTGSSIKESGGKGQAKRGTTVTNARGVHDDSVTDAYETIENDTPEVSTIHLCIHVHVHAERFQTSTVDVHVHVHKHIHAWALFCFCVIDVLQMRFALRSGPSVKYSTWYCLFQNFTPWASGVSAHLLRRELSSGNNIIITGSA